MATIRTLLCHLLVLNIGIMFFSLKAFAAEEQTELREQAEKQAIAEVLSPSDKAFFERVSAIPMLGFISPTNVMDYNTKNNQETYN